MSDSADLKYNHEKAQKICLDALTSESDCLEKIVKSVLDNSILSPASNLDIIEDESIDISSQIGEEGEVNKPQVKTHNFLSCSTPEIPFLTSLSQLDGIVSISSYRPCHLMKGAMKGHIDYNGQTYNVVNLQDWLNQQQLSSNSIIELQSGLKSNHTDYSYIVLLPRLWAIMISCLNGRHTYDDSGIRWRSCNKGTTELSQKTWLTGVVKDSLTPIFDANELSILFDETLKKPNLKGGDS